MLYLEHVVRTPSTSCCRTPLGTCLQGLRQAPLEFAVWCPDLMARAASVN